MRTLAITNGFATLSDANLLLKASQILTAMTGNVNFADPVPSLGDVDDAIDAFSEALDACRDGDRLKQAIKNQKKDELIVLLHLLADFVLFKSGGDSVKALSSGFSIAKSPSPAPPITGPASYTVEQGENSGELLSKAGRVKGAIGYLHQYATDAMMAEDNWKSVPSSRTTCIIPNLQPGTKYNCRVAVIGPRNQLVYSDIVSRIVA